MNELYHKYYPKYISVYDCEYVEFNKRLNCYCRVIHKHCINVNRDWSDWYSRYDQYIKLSNPTDTADDKEGQTKKKTSIFST